MADSRERAFRGIWFPAEVWEDERLSAIEKMILLEIDSLDNDGGCYATNKYLADFCHCSEATVKRAVSNLKELGLLCERSFDGRRRILCSNIHGVSCLPAQFDPADSSICAGRQLNLSRHLSIYESTRESTNKESNSVQKNTETDQTDELIDQVIEYLNSVTGKSFRKSTRDTRSRIRTLIRQGYSVDDFKKVIDRKAAQWLPDNNMEKYVRPKTLFSQENFDGYLNEGDAVPKKGGANGRQPGGPDTGAGRYAEYARAMQVLQ